MGSDSAETLMSLLPPVGWADVATKHDLAALGDRVLGAMHKDLNDMLLKMFALVVGMLGVVVAVVVPLVTLT